MLFLLRLAFWIMVICLLLPGSREDNRRLITSAEKTVADVRGFCSRNPDVCDDARATMTSLLSRLKSGTELLQVWIADEDKKDQTRIGQRIEGKNAPDTPSGPEPKVQDGGYPSQSTPLRPTPQWGDSLVPADRQMPWRGPSRL
jgi:hypothetical protein